MATGTGVFGLGGAMGGTSAPAAGINQQGNYERQQAALQRTATATQQQFDAAGNPVGSSTETSVAPLPPSLGALINYGSPGTSLNGGGSGSNGGSATPTALQPEKNAIEQQTNTLNNLPAIEAATGANQPPVTYGSTGTGTLASAQAANFAAAKDKAALIAKSALTALRDSAGQAGGGGGLEGYRTAKDVLAPAASGLGDINREQMVDANNAAVHQADTVYQGNLTQQAQKNQIAQSLIALLKPGAAY